MPLYTLKPSLYDHLRILTQYAGLVLENGPSLSQPHRASHLSWIVLRHVDHLQDKIHYIQTAVPDFCITLLDRWVSLPKLTTGCLDSGSNSVEFASVIKVRGLVKQ